MSRGWFRRLRPGASFRDVVAAYVGLTKPRVIELLLLTTVPVMFFAAQGVPPLGLVAATVVGGTLSAGSASVLNCVYDRDIDEQMRRTRRRALPRHLVSPPAALVFGLVLGVLSTVVLLVLGQLAVGGALAARQRVLRLRLHDAPQAPDDAEHRLGRAGRLLPGADRLDGGDQLPVWVPVVLFAVVFFWTPPHTWALALRYREDYANVEVPMLPVVAPAHDVGRQIVLYSWVMVACR